MTRRPRSWQQPLVGVVYWKCRYRLVLGFQEDARSKPLSGAQKSGGYMYWHNFLVLRNAWACWTSIWKWEVGWSKGNGRMKYDQSVDLLGRGKISWSSDHLQINHDRLLSIIWLHWNKAKNVASMFLRQVEFLLMDKLHWDLSIWIIGFITMGNKTFIWTSSFEECTCLKADGCKNCYHSAVEGTFRSKNKYEMVVSCNGHIKQRTCSDEQD